MVGVAVGVECGVGWSEDDAVVGGAGEVAEHMLGCSPVRCGGLGHVAGQRSHGLGNIRSGAGCQVHEGADEGGVGMFLGVEWLAVGGELDGDAGWCIEGLGLFHVELGQQVSGMAGLG